MSRTTSTLGASGTPPYVAEVDAPVPVCTRYAVLMRLGDRWAGRRDRRGLSIVDVDRLAQLGPDEPAAHLRWIRARSAEFAELDRHLVAHMERVLASDIEKLTELGLSLDQLRDEVDKAHALLEKYPPIGEDELSRRTIVEAEDDESVTRIRRRREYEARRRPIAARVEELCERHAAAQREIAERTARIHRVFDTTRQIALAQYAFYTKRVETYLRALLHRNPHREAVMSLLPSPVIVRPGWFDQPCPWPAHPVTAPIEEVSL